MAFPLHQTGPDPVGGSLYRETHVLRPNGTRRRPFVCVATDGSRFLGKIEADGEHPDVLPRLRARAGRRFGECDVQVRPTSGPPRWSGQPLRTFPPEWNPGEIRDHWTKV